MTTGAMNYSLPQFQRQHSAQHIVFVEEVMLERRRDMQQRQHKDRTRRRLVQFLELFH